MILTNLPLARAACLANLMLVAVAPLACGQTEGSDGSAGSGGASTGGSSSGGVGTGGSPSGGASTGGSPGSGTGSGGAGLGGTGGVDCDANPTCCPEGQPANGASCDAVKTCQYSVTVATCPTPISVSASCQAGEWQSPFAAGCGTSGAQCDPVGHWTVRATVPDPDQDPSLLPISFVISEASGVMYSSLTGIVVDLSACTLDGRWETSSEWELDGEFFSETLTETIELSQSGQAASGTYRFRCWGECGYDELDIPIVATKTEP